MRPRIGQPYLSSLAMPSDPGYLPPQRHCPGQTASDPLYDLFDQAKRQRRRLVSALGKVIHQGTLGA